ncbi:MAG TPA: 5'/3'-nucleotidase SurE [Candidatus Limnocylindrales bacterium]|nr:5'/3'-nucleotidase SurE [Candidatus Limnocylindrales bacterium]
MLALITNDDGIESPGLRQLALSAKESGLDVIVAAPVRESSGSSASVTGLAEDQRVVIEKRALSGLDGDPVFAVVASPGLIALLATRGAFGGTPDLVLSGINLGANAGHAVVHSGTVGAVVTGSVNGLRGMAVSLDVRGIFNKNEQRHWESAGNFVPQLVQLLMSLPSATVLNVNVPDMPADRVRGLRRARLGGFGQVQLAVAERGVGFVRTALEESAEHRPEPGTDMALLEDGYATVTPLAPLAEAPLELPLG